MRWCLFAILNRSSQLFSMGEYFLGEGIPVWKKLDPLKNDNYMPVSLLPHALIGFWGNHLSRNKYYMINKLSKCLTGFRILHRTQYLLITMLEKENIFLRYSWIFQKSLMQSIMTSCKQNQRHTDFHWMQ